MSEPEQVYQVEITNSDEVRWILAHTKRFLERATSLGKNLLLVVGTKCHTIRKLDELIDFATYLKALILQPLREGKAVLFTVYYAEQQKP